MEGRGVEPITFLPRKGDVFFWHAGLYHGGEPILDPARTRRSYVVHYSTRRSHRERVCTVMEPAPDGERPQLVRTRELLRDGEAVGFANPLAASDQSWGLTVRERIAGLLARF
jgi:hypothetical protein